MEHAEYAPGRGVDLHGSAEHGIALLWHGRGIDCADSMHPLAERVAGAGVLALSINWNSEAADGGRSDLLTSLQFTRDEARRRHRDPDSIVLAGWSLGGTAALGIARHAARLDVAIRGAVLIAPGDGPRVIDPISAAPLPRRPAPANASCRIDLAYGHDDPLATPDLVSGLELRLRASEWTTSLHAIDADHAEIIGTRYEPRTERYLRSRTSRARSAADSVAGIIIQAATTTP